MSTALGGPPELSGEHHVAPERVSEYRRKGHTVLREVATAEEIGIYRPLIRSAALRQNTETRPLAERDTYGRAFLQSFNLWTADEDVRRFSLARRFAGIAADLMGVDAVRIYHDQALFKEAGGGPTPWHQDQYYWPFDGDDTITMWMPLVDVPAAVGTMSFVTGSHRHGYLGDFGISDESDAVFAATIEERQLRTETHGAVQAGDATFHAGWTLHSAPGNPTSDVREVMTVIYFADGLRIAEPANDAQHVDLARWLPGLAPGDPAASRLNPIVYAR